MMHAITSIAALLFCGVSANASAQPYPTKPIRLVVGFAPGGAADTVARSVGEALGRELGQPIVIENRAGAGSSIAAENVARSAPDGYSLLIASPSSISVNPALNPKLNYRPQDLLPITKITASPLVIVVNPATPVTSLTFAELRLNRRIFSSRTPAEVMMDHLQRTPDLEPLPKSEQDVLLKALAKDPEQRSSNLDPRPSTRQRSALSIPAWASGAMMA